MRNVQHLISGLALSLVGAFLLAANALAQDARIVSLVGGGSATVTSADGQQQEARQGMTVARASRITTTAKEVYLEVMPGIVATIKPNSEVVVEALGGTEPRLELRQGSLISQIDRTRTAGKTYGVKTGRGVAAARGTSFTVTVNGTAISIATTADSVQFGDYTIRAGMISLTNAAGVQQTPVPLATAAATYPAIATLVRDAVQAVTTVVQNNLGEISADSATNIISQVVAVAVAAIPAEATTFTSQAVSAVTAPTSATAATPDAAATAAGAVTAAAVRAAPDQAAQIAGAAAQAAPAQSGVITAAAEQVAPAGTQDAIVQQVATRTGQSTSTVQNNANASSTQAARAVSVSNDATSNVVAPSTPAPQPTPAPETPPPATPPPSSIITPVDPTITSPSGG